MKLTQKIRHFFRKKVRIVESRDFRSEFFTKYTPITQFNPDYMPSKKLFKTPEEAMASLGYDIKGFGIATNGPESNWKNKFCNHMSQRKGQRGLVVVCVSSDEGLRGYYVELLQHGDVGVRWRWKIPFSKYFIDIRRRS